MDKEKQEERARATIGKISTSTEAKKAAVSDESVLREAFLQKPDATDEISQQTEKANKTLVDNIRNLIETVAMNELREHEYRFFSEVKDQGSIELSLIDDETEQLKSDITTPIAAAVFEKISATTVDVLYSQLVDMRKTYAREYEKDVYSHIIDRIVSDLLRNSFVGMFEARKIDVSYDSYKKALEILKKEHPKDYDALIKTKFAPSKQQTKWNNVIKGDFKNEEDLDFALQMLNNPAIIAANNKFIVLFNALSNAKKTYKELTKPQEAEQQQEDMVKAHEMPTEEAQETKQQLIEKFVSLLNRLIRKPQKFVTENVGDLKRKRGTEEQSGGGDKRRKVESNNQSQPPPAPSM